MKPKLIRKNKIIDGCKPIRTDFIFLSLPGRAFAKIGYDVIRIHSVTSASFHTLSLVIYRKSNKDNIYG
jgi:hypothetical protein